MTWCMISTQLVKCFAYVDNGKCTGAVAPLYLGIKYLPPSGFMQTFYINVTDLPETDSLINTVDNFVHFSVIIAM